MNRVLYISDFFHSDIAGGAELNDHILLQELSNRGIKVSKIRSFHVFLETLKEDWDLIIISNFCNLKPNLIKYIFKNKDYVIYEHDHKYLRSRNPSLFKDFKAPRFEIVNENFYKSAKRVYCQSSFHLEIVKKNIDLNNLYNVSGNLWSKDTLEVLEKMLTKSKQNKFSIMNSSVSHKNTKDAVRYCQKKQIDYDLVESKDYHEFLSKMSDNETLIFIPKTPETLSRIVVEARMMGMKTVTNKNIGATHEPWFSMKGKELIDYMKNKKVEIVDSIMEMIK